MVPEMVPLPGGYSGETFLATSAGERSVVRIYAGRSAARGAEAAHVDAAVLRLVRGLVPVPDVLEVRRADESLGTPALLVTRWLEGTRLDEVLPEVDDDAAASLGRAVGTVVARLAQLPMPRVGLFVDSDLTIGALPPGGEDLPAWVSKHTATGPLAAWEALDRAALADLAERAQDLIDPSQRVCLVHGDLNPKNVLVDADAGEVRGVVDWEFAHAGSPFSDLGNLLRFDRRPAFADAVLAAYVDQVVDAPPDTLARARAADLFALIELAARKQQSSVVTAARDLLLRMARSGELSRD